MDLIQVISHVLVGIWVSFRDVFFFFCGWASHFPFRHSLRTSAASDFPLRTYSSIPSLPYIVHSGTIKKCLIVRRTRNDTEHHKCIFQFSSVKSAVWHPHHPQPSLRSSCQRDRARRSTYAAPQGLATALNTVCSEEQFMRRNGVRQKKTVCVEMGVEKGKMKEKIIEVGQGS
jgi:hypothetical protein